MGICYRTLQGFYRIKRVKKLELNRYIHLNPVRAKHSAKAPKTTGGAVTRAYIGARDDITDTEDTLYAFAKKRAIAVKRYKEFIKVGIGESSPLKKAVGSVLGDETFRQKAITYKGDT